MPFLAEPSAETETAPSLGPTAPAPTKIERNLNIAAWVLLGAVTAWVSWQSLKHDFRTEALVGDQASFYLQILSLAHDGHDLSYNALDYARWQVVEWRPVPYGLYFQAFSGGWAFAKPYGYSVLAAPFYRLLGPIVGVAFTNTALIWALLGTSIAILRQWLRGAVVPLVTLAFVFASNAYLYAYPVGTDLFLPALVGVCAYLVVYGTKHDQWWPVALAAGVLAFLVAEKTTMLVALLPLVGYGFWQVRSWQKRVLVALGFVMVLAVSIVPYLHYSDGKSWNAYGGDRYYGRVQVPFQPLEPGEEMVLDPVATDENFTVTYITNSIRHNIPEALKSAFYFLFGRHVGLLVIYPIALFGIGLALWRAKTMSPEAIAALVGIILYVGLYLVLFPDNFWGGGQAIGNRYFLQIAPLVLVVIAGTKIPSRWLGGAAVLAVACSLTFQWHAHQHPSETMYKLWHQSPAQAWLPFETNQDGRNYWNCGAYICDDNNPKLAEEEYKAWLLTQEDSKSQEDSK